jgi:hypothetical protein
LELVSASNDLEIGLRMERDSLVPSSTSIKMAGRSDVGSKTRKENTSVVFWIENENIKYEHPCCNHKWNQDMRPI